MKFSIFQFITLLLFFTACTKENTGIKPQYRDVTEAVYSTVLVKPRISYIVYSPTTGIIDKLMIDIGDEVQKGSLLLKVSDSKSKVNIQNAQLKYEIARESYKGESAILKEIAEQIKTANVKLQNDSLNYERQKRLWQQDVGSKKEYEKYKLAFDIAKNDLDRLSNSYKRNNAELQRQMEIAKNQLKLNQLNDEDLTLKSKIDGLVYNLEKDEGEYVTPQSPIAVIGSKSDFIISLLIDEKDIRKVYSGQETIISLDAYPDSIYHAKVSKIYPEKDERSLTFTVEAEFVTSPNRLLKGLSGEANIIINTKQKVLTLPSQYISSEEMVNTNDGMIAIKTGLKSLEFTEITSGIDSSTIIKILK